MPETLPIAKGSGVCFVSEYGQPSWFDHRGYGTGKTVTLRVIAEKVSVVPVFLADVKGDLSGVAKPGREIQRPGE